MIKNILVTGSSGTIGTRLCEILLKEGFNVIGADRRPNEWNEVINNVTVKIDLRDKERMMQILPKDIDLSIHLAANARVYDLVVDPVLARDNFETIFNMLEFSRTNNIKKFMFASSREVYGNSNKSILQETDADITNIESPYAACKFGGEALVQSYKRCYDIDFTLFRFSNVYGMYDNSNRVVPLFIKMCKENKDLIVYGKEKILDFTYIDDCINGIILAIQKFNDIKNDTFNIAYGKGKSILEVAELIKKELKTKNKIILQDNRPGEVVKYIADITKAKDKLGYSPKITVEEGIKKSVNWYSTLHK